MRKKIILTIFIMLGIFLSGCGKTTEKDIINDLTKKLEKANSYSLTGVLKLINEEESYIYDVSVAYQSKDKFKVNLVNQTNNHEQIILRNENGVYVLTPSLKKSFKFESDWPYNNSQIYILPSLIDDINGDKKYNFKETKDGYIFKTTVNYPNNSNLVKQKIYLDKKNNLKKVEVLNRESKVQMTMKFNNIKLNEKFNKQYFDLNKNLEVSKQEEETKTVSKVEDGIYPMYLPTNTYLDKEDKVSKENGERIIMTFSGEKPFMMIQETIETSENQIIPVSGEPTLLPDSISAMSENEIVWVNNGIEYYIVSNELKNDELMKVAKSIGVASVVNQK